MNNFAGAAILSVGLLVQGAAVMRNQYRHLPQANCQVSLDTAKPHVVKGAPVLLADGDNKNVAPAATFAQAGNAHLVDSPFFGAGRIALFGT